MKRLLITLLFLPIMAHAADAPTFKRGINLSNWLANATRQPVLTHDFVQLKKAGFDHVRLPVNPEHMGFTLEGESLGDFAAVDAAITQARAQHLAVILDMHPRGDFMQRLERDAQAQQKFTALWVMLAKRYRAISADQLSFELINEPQYYDREEAYQTFAESLVAAIRGVDATRTLIVAAPRGSSIAGLQQLKPIPDAHIAYDVHFYEPYIFTHQGIHQGFEKKMVRYFHDVPYPASLAEADAARYAEHAPDAAQAQRELDIYRREQWDAQHIAERMQLVRAWAGQYRAQVMCGEFGVLRNHADPASRYRWITDVRQALEANGMAWQLWDYTDLFGITQLMGETATDPIDGSVRFRDAQQGKRVLEPEALKALGLK